MKQNMEVGQRVRITPPSVFADMTGAIVRMDGEDCAIRLDEDKAVVQKYVVQLVKDPIVTFSAAFLERVEDSST